MNPGHQPQRFQFFTLLPNERSFTIKDSTHVYLFDRYGGWFDQYGNYYNQNCEPDDPPSSSQSYSHQEEKQHSIQSEGDQFQKQFGRPGQQLDSESEEEVQTLAAIAQNQYLLKQYPKDTQIRVYFENISRQNKKIDVFNAYRQICKGVLSVNFDKSFHEGYFIVADYQNAMLLIQQEGKQVIDRPLFFIVQKYEQNILNPIVQSELSMKEEVKSKKYVQKEVEQKKLQELSKEMPICWKWYKFEKNIFPKQTSFKKWMYINGFIFQQDFKNVQRILNDPEKKYVKIEMKQSTFQSLVGLQFEGKKVQFLPA